MLISSDLSNEADWASWTRATSLGLSDKQEYELTNPLSCHALDSWNDDPAKYSALHSQNLDLLNVKVQGCPTGLEIRNYKKSQKQLTK